MARSRNLRALGPDYFSPKMAHRWFVLEVVAQEQTEHPVGDYATRAHATQAVERFRRLARAYPHCRYRIVKFVHAGKEPARE